MPTLNQQLKQAIIAQVQKYNDELKQYFKEHITAQGLGGIVAANNTLLHCNIHQAIDELVPAEDTH